jgi:cyclic pyranopterin phosphate synthase
MVSITTPDEAGNQRLIDGFNREINYLRLSVTDRCDFRCTYCMSENMSFTPLANILSIKELEHLAREFISLGVSRIRITGGEPLVRRDIIRLVNTLAELDGLRELTLSTNGANLRKYARPLRDAGIDRVNISIDSLRPDRFRSMTRHGSLSKVLDGIDAAIESGFRRIKLNSVILRGKNDDEIIDLVAFARSKKIDIAFIEEMPLGAIVEHSRASTFLASDTVKEIISEKYPLALSDHKTGGPSVYYSMVDSPSNVALISPHSKNFCHLCNRVRVTAEGKLLLCLGNEHAVDLREIIRSNPGQLSSVKDAIIRGLALKPERHYFDIHETQIVRFMNMTGG